MLLLQSRFVTQPQNVAEQPITLYSLQNKEISQRLGALPRGLGSPLAWDLTLLHEFQQYHIVFQPHALAS